MAWRMVKMCDNCPFALSGAGLHLRQSLRRGRWQEIITFLRNDGHFTCHKTSDETGDGSNLMCAGAITWQEEHGLVGNLQRIMERIHGIYGTEGTASVRSSLQQVHERFKKTTVRKRKRVNPCQK
jgi:hypothetical protein